MILQSDEAVVVTAQEEFVDTLPNGRLVPNTQVTYSVLIQCLQVRPCSEDPETSG